MGGFSEVGFDGWPLKGLLFLEIEQGEVQGKVTLWSPALGKHGAGMGNKQSSSPRLGHSPAWVVALGSSRSELGHPSCVEVQQQGLREGGRQEMQKMEGSWIVSLCCDLVGAAKNYMEHPNLVIALEEVICGVL